MKTLLIVDPQNDFIEGGKLAVEGGKQALDNIATFIKENLNNINRIIVTADWHPGNHSSFSNFGGEFPEHCVQKTFGAQIYKPLDDTIQKSNIACYLLLKGMDVYKDNFTAFLEDEVPNLRNSVIIKTTDPQLKEMIFFNNVEEVIVCGLAGDYCVLETIKALVHEGFDNITILKDGIASIDGGNTLNNYLENGYK